MGSGGLGAEGGVSRSTGGSGLGGYRGGGGGVAHVSAPPRNRALTELTSVLQSAKRSYLLDRFVNPAIRQTVSVVLQFRIAVVADRRWDWVTENYQVTDGPGCLRNFVAALAEAAGEPATTEYQRSFLRQCLESFFIQAVGNNTRLYLTGDAGQVLDALGRNMHAFEHVLTHFLTSGIDQVSRRAFDQLPPESGALLGELTRSLGEKVCDRFRARYLGKIVAGTPVTSMAQMLDVIASDNNVQEWFLSELRQP